MSSMRLPGPDSRITSEVGHVLATGALWEDDGLYMIILDNRADSPRMGEQRKVEVGLNDSTLADWVAAHWPPTFAGGSCMCRFAVACALCPVWCRAPYLGSPYPCTFPVRLGGQVREPGSGQGNK